MKENQKSIEIFILKEWSGYNKLATCLDDRNIPDCDFEIIPYVIERKILLNYSLM